jgi:hypothetical protein
MDAVTSLELEAQRRRETVANDRDMQWALARASTDAVEAPLDRPVATRTHAADRSAGVADRQPTPLARNPAA